MSRGHLCSERWFKGERREILFGGKLQGCQITDRCERAYGAWLVVRGPGPFRVNSDEAVNQLVEEMQAEKPRFTRSKDRRRRARKGAAFIVTVSLLASACRDASFMLDCRRVFF